MQRKTKVSIAVLLLSTITLAIVIPFLFVNLASPLGIWIEVGISCEETQVAVPDNLTVTCEGMGHKFVQWTKNGHVLFGSGLIDGTYTISWYWNAPYSYEVKINCSQITWHFDYYVPNPTITKHFFYDAKYFDNPPVVGLEVRLYEYYGAVGGLKATGYTDATGTVVFDGHFVDVGKTYQLRYTWGGVEYIIPAKGEPDIYFGYTDGKLLKCAWEETNLLPPNSGGGINLHLAEERG